MRGNLAHCVSPMPTLRSIPACAGEPRIGARINALDEVYPRVCGGTIARVSGSFARAGLSPRVRGNLNPLREIRRFRRSIPACAGEPLRRS